MRPVDVLHPFRNADQNRKETLLIEYGSFIINRSANLIYALLQNLPKYQQKYPNINLFFDMNARAIYEATKYYDPFELLVTLANKADGSGTAEEYLSMRDDFFELEKVDNTKYTISTMFSYALGKMMQERCFSKAYILKSQVPFNPWELNYIRKIYGPLGEKIEFIEASIMDFYQEEKENLTTIFINHVDTLLEIANIPNHEEFTNMQLFSIRISNEIIKEVPGTHKYIYTCGTAFDELEKLKIHTSVIQCDVYSASGGIMNPPIYTG